MASPKKIIISTGHGLRPDGKMDNGAFDVITKTSEFSLNSKVSAYCVAALEAQRAFNVGTDSGLLGSSRNPSWRQLKAYLAAHPGNVDLVVEVHHDMPSARTAGFGIMPRISKYDSIRLCNEITKAYALRRLGTKPSYRDVRGLGILRGLTQNVLIWECANTTFATEEVLKARGEGIAAGICAWFGVQFTTPVVKRFELGRGSTGELVKRLQLKLNVDTSKGGFGIFGPKTETAVKAWQHENNLPATGLLDSLDLMKLGLK
jgi:hypothetical protein